MILLDYLMSLPIRELKSEISIWLNDNHVSGQVKDFITSDYANMVVLEHDIDTLDNMNIYVLKGANPYA